MKREFLQALQEDQPLSKQTVDAIMAENGRDIQATRALFSDYDTLKEELAAAQKTIATLEEGSSKAWEEKLSQLEQQHRTELRQMEFGFMLRQAVAEKGGRNQKAVEALLDIPGLQAAEDPQKATYEALGQMQKENPWLFQTETPPPYARGTGAQNPQITEQPVTLAGALREKFERK